jgi:hypothetical protein
MGQLESLKELSTMKKKERKEMKRKKKPLFLHTMGSLMNSEC